MIKELMEQKLKFILVGVAGIVLILFFLYLQALTSKQPLIRERDDLKNENASFLGKISELENRLRDNVNRINSLNSELDRVSKEKQEIEKKYDWVSKEREELVAKVQSREARAPVAAQPQPILETSDAYWAGILRTKTELELQLDRLSNELKSTKISNEELAREKSALQLDITNLGHDKEELNRQLAYNQKLMDSMSQELVREKNAKIEIENSFKSIRNENKVLTRMLKNLNSRKISLERKLQELEEQNSKLEKRFTEMETMLTDKTSQMGDLRQQLDSMSEAAVVSKTEAQIEEKQSIELPEIIVRPQPEGQPLPQETETVVPSRVGKVLALNKENNFVIIDLGQNSGINPGDTFRIYRENDAIASIEVIQVRPDIAACDIKNEASTIKVGDTVR